MRNNKFLKTIISKRSLIQIILGVALFVAITRYEVSLWWVLAFGVLTGVIWGKIFCRWICPMGIIMEVMMKLNPSDSFRSMYQYHKIGCPIAWISGFLNKVSFYRINFNQDTCKNCGLCDSACYMPSIDTNRFSLYKTDKCDPSTNFSCSKCLECVAACPNGSLSYNHIFSTNSNKYESNKYKSSQ